MWGESAILRLHRARDFDESLSGPRSKLHEPREFVSEPSVILVSGACNLSTCGLDRMGPPAPRYGRYKSRLWRHTHDTLNSQNGAPCRERGYGSCISLGGSDRVARPSRNRQPSI